MHHVARCVEDDSLMPMISKANNMKKRLLLSTALLASGLCAAQDMGRVISATPIIQQVGMPRQVCSTEQVAIQQPKSGAGAAMGAIAGGAIGNAIGGGGGQAAATMLGIFGGAVLGDRVEGSPAPYMQNVQRCATQTFYENRTVAYNVVYEFAGKQYAVQMPHDPGPTVALQIAPMGASQPNAAPPVVSSSPQPVYEQASPVIVQSTVYPGYYAQPVYPPVAVQLGFGYWGGYRGHHHWR